MITCVIILMGSLIGVRCMEDINLKRIFRFPCVLGITQCTERCTALVGCKEMRYDAHTLTCILTFYGKTLRNGKKCICDWDEVCIPLSECLTTRRWRACASRFTGYSDLDIVTKPKSSKATVSRGVILVTSNASKNMNLVLLDVDNHHLHPLKTLWTRMITALKYQAGRVYWCQRDMDACAYLRMDNMKKVHKKYKMTSNTIAVDVKNNLVIIVNKDRKAQKLTKDLDSRGKFGVGNFVVRGCEVDSKHRLVYFVKSESHGILTFTYSGKRLRSYRSREFIVTIAKADQNDVLYMVHKRHHLAAIEDMSQGTSTAIKVLHVPNADMPTPIIALPFEDHVIVKLKGYLLTFKKRRSNFKRASNRIALPENLDDLSPMAAYTKDTDYRPF